MHQPATGLFKATTWAGRCATWLASLFILLNAASAQTRAGSTAHRLPREVIVGTVVHSFWTEDVGLSTRLERLMATIDRMAEQSKKQYGRSLDPALLPENAVTGGRLKGIAAAVPFEGQVHRAFAEMARLHRCYIVVPMSLLEGKLFSNAAVLIDRKGEIAGIYRKLHLAVLTGEESYGGRRHSWQGSACL